MDEAQLLKEFDELNRLLSDHESKQHVIPNCTKRMPDERKPVVTEEIVSKPSIFINLKKINSVKPVSRTFKNSENSFSDRSKMPAKVFINPNFRKQDLSSTQVLSKLNESKETKDKSQLLSKTSYTRLSQQTNRQHLVKIHQLPTQKLLNYNHPTLKLKVVEHNQPSSNKHKIFFNPEFSSSSKLRACPPKPSSNIIVKKTESCDLTSNSQKANKIVEPKLAMNLNRKRKVVLGQSKPIESSVVDPKRKKEANNTSGSVPKIFVNPNFERKENVMKNHKISSSESKSSNTAIINKSTCLSSVQTSVPSSSNSFSQIPVLIGGKEVTNKLIPETFPLCTVIGLNRAKQEVKKPTRQRIRTLSSSLVLIGRTKLVRKNKSKHKTVEISGKPLSQPLFLSKTKLVRNVAKLVANNNCLTKNEPKTSNKIIQAQLLSLRGRLKIRRRNSTNLSNLIPVVQKPESVTKIRSKNGKSLKLIRKSAESTSSATILEKEKREMIVKSRKMELRQQARIFRSSFQNRLKNNQFSKINVPLTNPQSTSCYNNVYKKNYVSRKPLTKAALVGKKEAINRMNSQARNTPLDLTKFVRSKYRLIRKHSSNSMSRYKPNGKTASKNLSRYKMVQRKKLRWKRKSDISARRLTRKDLRIKKIGGVFYKYSRTTLTKNNPSKTVSQPQKRIHQALGVRRYSRSRYCINKLQTRKQARANRVQFVAPPAGMSWKRTDYDSPRSILTQANKKSVYLLSKKLKKNNEPCLFFHRHGRCAGLQRGTCVRLHDKKYVAVCKKFLQGSCTDDQCTLSHAPTCHNMPTCHHFLAGQCGRDNCAYPHIKVSDSAPVCLDFLKGYCTLGDKCSKRHFEICPSFEKGTCARGKYCPYPHPKNKSDNLKGKFKRIKRKPDPPRNTETVSKPSLRYFEDVGLKKENEICLKEEQEENKDDYEETEEVTRPKKRPQLGELPSFIPLSCSFQEDS